MICYDVIHLPLHEYAYLQYLCFFLRISGFYTLYSLFIRSIQPLIFVHLLIHLVVGPSIDPFAPAGL